MSSINCILSKENQKIFESKNEKIKDIINSLKVFAPNFSDNVSISKFFTHLLILQQLKESYLFEVIIPNVSKCSVQEVFKFNELITKNKDMLEINTITENDVGTFLCFIIREIFFYINLRTKDNILLVKLRAMKRKKFELKSKIETLKKCLVNKIHEDNFTF